MSQNISARKKERIKLGTVACMIIGLISILVTGGAIYLTASNLMCLLSRSPFVAQYGVSMTWT